MRWRDKDPKVPYVDGICLAERNTAHSVSEQAAPIDLLAQNHKTVYARRSELGKAQELAQARTHTMILWQQTTSAEEWHGSDAGRHIDKEYAYDQVIKMNTFKYFSCS